MKKVLILFIIILLLSFSSLSSCQSSTSTIKADQEMVKKAKAEYPEYDSSVLSKRPSEFLTTEGIFTLILNQAIEMYNKAVATEDFDLLEQAGYGFFYIYGYTGSNIAKEYLNKIRNFKTKKLEEYISLAKKYEKNKDIITAASYWGKVLKIDKDNKEAKAFFEKNKELIKKEIQRYLSEAKKFLEKKKFEEAEKLYKAVLLFDPNNLEAKTGLEKVKQEKGKLALDSFNKAVAAFNKKEYNQAQKLFKLALDLGYDKKKIKEYLDKIDLIMNIEKYYQSCIDAFNKKDFFTAENFAKKVINLDSNYKDIKDLYQQIQKGIEDTLLSWYNQAVELYNQKAYDKALELFQKIAKYNPNYKDIQSYIQSCQAKLQALSGSGSGG